MFYVNILYNKNTSSVRIISDQLQKMRKQVEQKYGDWKW